MRFAEACRNNYCFTASTCRVFSVCSCTSIATPLLRSRRGSWGKCRSLCRLDGARWGRRGIHRRANLSIVVDFSTPLTYVDCGCLRCFAAVATEMHGAETFATAGPWASLGRVPVPKIPTPSFTHHCCLGTIRVLCEKSCVHSLSSPNTLRMLEPFTALLSEQVSWTGLKWGRKLLEGCVRRQADHSPDKCKPKPICVAIKP